jgi:hypothetical protein
MNRLGAVLLVGLVGCSDYATGQRQRGELNCELLDVCGSLETLGYPGLAACKQAANEQEFSDDDCPDFDASAMAACLDAYEAAIDAADCAADLTEVCAVCG